MAQRPGHCDIVSADDEGQREADSEVWSEPADGRAPGGEKGEETNGIARGRRSQDQALRAKVSPETSAEEEYALEGAALDVGPDGVLGRHEKDMRQEKKEEPRGAVVGIMEPDPCLLYTSDAAD